MHSISGFLLGENLWKIANLQKVCNFLIEFDSAKFKNRVVIKDGEGLEKRVAHENTWTPRFVDRTKFCRNCFQRLSEGDGSELVKLKYGKKKKKLQKTKSWVSFQLSKNGNGTSRGGWPTV